jgi:hypothetical protein
MLGDGAVDAEYYWLGFAGQLRDAQRPWRRSIWDFEM